MYLVNNLAWAQEQVLLLLLYYPPNSNQKIRLNFFSSKITNKVHIFSNIHTFRENVWEKNRKRHQLKV